MKRYLKAFHLQTLVDLLVLIAVWVYLDGVLTPEQLGTVFLFLFGGWLVKNWIDDAYQDKAASSVSVSSSAVADDEDDDWDDDFDDEDDLDDGIDGLDEIEDDEAGDRAHDHWRIDEDDDIYGDEAELFEYERGKVKRGQ